MVQAEKNRLVDTRVLLNNRPARIIGRLLPFPRVRDMRADIEAEFAWETVARVVAAGGRFKI